MNQYILTDIWDLLVTKLELIIKCQAKDHINWCAKYIQSDTQEGLQETLQV